LGFSSFSGRDAKPGNLRGAHHLVPKALVAINHVFDGEVSDRYLPTAPTEADAAPDRRVGGAVLTSPSTSSLSTSIPVSPLDTASATLPTRVATTGGRQLASMIASGKPSDRESKAMMSKEAGGSGDRPPSRAGRAGH